MIQIDFHEKNDLTKQAFQKAPAPTAESNKSDESDDADETEDADLPVTRGSNITKETEEAYQPTAAQKAKARRANNAAKAAEERAVQGGCSKFET